MINLLANKLILACSVGLVGVSVIALPTSLALTSGKSMGDIFKPLNDAIDTATTQGKTHFDTFDKNLNNEYTNFGNKVVDNAEESPKTVSAQLQSISSDAKTIAQIANEHKKTANYYIFKLGHLINAVLKHIPSIAKESIVESISGGEDKHLLSVQKIYNIASNEKFGEFLAAMTTVVTQHGELLSNLSNEDNSGIIQIFKELQNDPQEITKFLEKVKTNSTNLESDSDSYQCATKLMMHVLIGKAEMENIAQAVTKLNDLLEKVKTSLETEVLAGTQLTVEGLKTQLTEISAKAEHIKNPCKQQKS